MNCPQHLKLSSLAAVALTLAGALGWRLWGSGSTREVGGETTPAPLAYRFALGELVTYRLVLSSTQQNALLAGAGRPSVSGLTLDTELAFDVKAIDAPQGRVTVALSFQRVRQCDLRLLDADVFQTLEEARAQLEGHELWATLDERGHVLGARYPADATPAFKALAHTVLSETQLVLGPGERWTETEDSPLARVVYTYERDGGPNPQGRLQLIKRPREVVELRGLEGAGAVTSVDGQATAIISADGRLLQARGQQRLVARRRGAVALSLESAFELERLAPVQRRLARAPPPTVVPPTQEVPLAAAPVASEPPEFALQRRAGTLTPETVVAGVRAFALTGPTGTHADFLWSATALLRLSQEGVETLASVFTDPEVKVEARFLAFELLAAAGTPLAQARMRDVLEAMREGPERRALASRLTLLPAPDHATVSWARARLGASDPQTRWSAAMALGGMARQLTKRGSAREAEALVTALTGALHAATDPRDRQALLRGLGNAASPGAAAAALGYTRSGSPETRVAATAALRSTQTSETEAAVLALVADPSGRVQQEALRVLARYRLQPWHLARLEEHVRAGHLHADAFADAVTLAGRAHAQGEPVRPLADALAARADLEPTIRARLNDLLARLKP